MKTTKLTSVTIAATVALVLTRANWLKGQPASSLTEREIESSETRTAFGALLRENEELRRKLAVTEAALTAIQRNLAASNAEAEVLKRKASELSLRLEALSLDAAGDGGKIEQRLLKAVSDLRLAESDREAVRKALVELFETTLRYQSVSTVRNAEFRLALEAAMRGAAKVLGNSSDPTVESAPELATLTDGMVIAIKEDLALVVANIGSKHGVKIGMPFHIMRNRQRVGTVRVVDVREQIAGAVIQDLRSETEKIQIGDQLKIGAER